MRRQSIVVTGELGRPRPASATVPSAARGGGEPRADTDEHGSEADRQLGETLREIRLHEGRLQCRRLEPEPVLRVLERLPVNVLRADSPVARRVPPGVDVGCGLTVGLASVDASVLSLITSAIDRAATASVTGAPGRVASDVVVIRSRSSPCLTSRRAQSPTPISQRPAARVETPPPSSSTVRCRRHAHSPARERVACIGKSVSRTRHRRFRHRARRVAHGMATHAGSGSRS